MDIAPISSATRAIALTTVSALPPVAHLNPQQAKTLSKCDSTAPWWSASISQQVRYFRIQSWGSASEVSLDTHSLSLVSWWTDLETKIWMQIMYLASSPENINMGVGRDTGDEGKTLRGLRVCWQQFTSAVNLGSILLRSLGDSVAWASGFPLPLSSHSRRCHPAAPRPVHLRESPQAESDRHSQSAAAGTD